MQRDTIRTVLQAATLAIVALGALSGVAIWTIGAVVAQEVEPLQRKVATLEQQGIAIIQLQNDVANLKQNVANLKQNVAVLQKSVSVLEGDSQEILEALKRIEKALPPPPRRS